MSVYKKAAKEKRTYEVDVDSNRLSPSRLRLPNCIPTFSTEPNELGMTTGWSINLFRTPAREDGTVVRGADLSDGGMMVADVDGGRAVKGRLTGKGARPWQA